MAGRFIRCMIAAAAVSMLAPSAFADSFPVRMPEGAPGLDSVVVSDDLPDPHRVNLVAANPLEGTSFAVRGARGSLAVGLLFGPLGVAANAAAVADANSERGSRLGSFVQTDVRALLRQSTPATPQPAASGASFQLVPMVVTNFSDDTHFKLECYVFAYVQSGERWGRGNFVAHGDGEFDVDQADSMTEAAAALPACMQRVYAAFVTYVDHHGEFTENARVRLEGAGAQRLHYARTDDGHVVFNFLNMVRSYPSDMVEFVD